MGLFCGTLVVGVNWLPLNEVNGVFLCILQMVITPHVIKSHQELSTLEWQIFHTIRWVTYEGVGISAVNFESGVPRFDSQWVSVGKTLFL